MKSKLFLHFMAIFFLMAGIAGQAHSNDQIKWVSVAEVEKQIIDKEGKKAVKREPAVKVRPGTEVIFTTTYQNTGNEAAQKVVITNPIPDHLIYMENSAIGLMARITFSVDKGKSFHAPSQLFIFDASGRKFPANPQYYTHIRWEIQKVLPPGGVGTVSFRAVLR